MTVLVTGSSGFIGSRLVAELEAQGQSVRVLDRSRHDLTRPESLQGLCDGVQIIYHLAAYAHINQVDGDVLRQVNIDGTRHLLRAAIDAGVPRMVYLSSILADPEVDQPRTAYGDSKWQAESLLQQAHQAGEIEAVILRPVNVYGPGMKGNLMTLMRLIQRGVMPPLPRFSALLSLVGVDDLCDALIKAGQTLSLEEPRPFPPVTDGPPSPVHLSSTSAHIPPSVPESSSPPGRESAPDRPGTQAAPVLEITDGQPYVIKDLEIAMRQALGKPVPRWAVPAPVFYLAALGAEACSRVLRLRNAPGLRSYRALSQGQRADNSKARQQLGYNPRSTFYSELPRIVAAMSDR